MNAANNENMKPDLVNSVITGFVVAFYLNLAQTKNGCDSVVARRWRSEKIAGALLRPIIRVCLR